jgi:membrane associated rhomboid family serine protease
VTLPSPPVVQHCYRHPDRETGRFCTRCGRPACSDCLVQASVGSHCLDCAKAAKPDVRDRAKLWNARQPTLVTYVLIAVNVAVFALTAIDDPGTIGFGGGVSEMQARLGLSRQILETGGCYSRTVCFEPHEWYRLVTSGFLHFGIIHIGFNMILLYQLGQLLEPRLGRARFALLYFAALLAGSLGELVIGGGTAIAGGASGAVFGLMAAAAIGMYRQGINIFSTGIGSLLILNLVLTFTIPGIAIGGHLGGAIGGAICGFAMLAPPWKAPPRWLTYVAPLVVGIGSVAASVMVVGT